MNNEVLAYDCDGLELCEFDIVRTQWYVDLDFVSDLEANPRQYTVIKGKDSIPVLVSIYDEENKEFINRYEGRDIDSDVPVDIRPITDSVYFEKALDKLGNDMEFDYLQPKAVTLSLDLD